jgi:sugar lactone lactonase YvrE
MTQSIVLRSLSVLVLGLAACGGGQPSGAQGATSSETSGNEPTAVERLTAPLMVQNVGFQTPESVLYDAQSDVYLVSNIQGSPLDADDQAFISRVKPDGTVAALKWIDSSKADVELDAPKGMAVSNGVLYVADITKVRKFELATGKQLGSIPIEGTTFLNDITVDRNGNVYVSDSGLTTGFSPSGTDAVYRITKDDKVTPIIKDTNLGRPNGLYASNDGLWVVTFGSGELYKLGEDGQRSDVHKLPKGSLDGVIDAGGKPLVSSWEASAVYRLEDQGPVEVISGVSAPADIGYDSKRNRVLIPLFNDNAVAIHQL